MSSILLAVETFHDRTAWLEARRQGIGASDAADVLGVGRRSPMTLYCEKLGLAEPDPLEAEAVEWGLLLEPVLVQRYKQITGRDVVGSSGPSIVRSEQHPWMTFSPDGWILADPRGSAPLQIKTAGAFRAADWDDEPPLSYQVQVQHEIAVTGARWGALAVLLGGQRFRHYEIERNETFIATLIEREAEFWRRLQEQDPPPIDGSDAARELLRKLYPRETPGVVVNLPSEAIEWDAELQEIKAGKKKADARAQALENMLKAALGEAETGLLSNGVQFTWKAGERKGYVVEPTTTRTLRRKESAS